MELPETDPEKLSLLLVQQWLSEKGFASALRALEKEAGILYDENKLAQGAQLMQLVWGHMEAALAADVDDEAAARMAEEAALLRGGSEDYAQHPCGCVEAAHPSSITCVRVWPGRAALLTGAGDGHVRLLDFSGDIAWETRVGSGGVLCIDLLVMGSHQPLVAVGSMDGSLSVLDAADGGLLASSKPHAKYLVRVLWALGGSRILTASHDQSVGVHEWGLATQGGPDEASGGSTSTQIRSIKQVPYPGAVQDITLLHDGHTLAVAVQGSNYLRLLDLDDLQAPEQLVNMNEARDDHVSFSARHLALSRDGRFLLVSTDTPRVLMLRTSGWGLARAFFATAEQFHNPVAAWHHDGFYIYVAAVGGQVWVFHVGTCKVVAKLPAHKINVRDLVYDVQQQLLVTCSFDKSIKLFGQHPADVQSANS